MILIFIKLKATSWKLIFYLFKIYPQFVYGIVDDKFQAFHDILAINFIQEKYIL